LLSLQLFFFLQRRAFFLQRRVLSSALFSFFLQSFLSSVLKLLPLSLTIFFSVDYPCAIVTNPVSSGLIRILIAV
jgi:hypothetical protein